MARNRFLAPAWSTIGTGLSRSSRISARANSCLGASQGAWICRGGKPCQFWNVATNVVTFGIEPFPLRDRVEDSKVGLSIAATTARPLPSEIVPGSVAVYQPIEVMAFTQSKIDEQILLYWPAGNQQQPRPALFYVTLQALNHLAQVAPTMRCASRRNSRPLLWQHVDEDGFSLPQSGIERQVTAQTQVIASKPDERTYTCYFWGVRQPDVNCAGQNKMRENRARHRSALALHRACPRYPKCRIWTITRALPRFAGWL